MPFRLCHKSSNGQWRRRSCGNKPLLTLGASLIKILAIFVGVCLPIVIMSSADARHRHAYHSRHRIHAPNVCNERGCLSHAIAYRDMVSQAIDANGNIVGRRPVGCPRNFCGCEASLYVFGAIRPELNLASNWIRKFPRTLPAPGMAAVRNHHVMVLRGHVDGSNWLVHDGNSGGGLTRDHVRSINGYTIVDPQGSRSVRQLQ